MDPENSRDVVASGTGMRKTVRIGRNGKSVGHSHHICSASAWKVNNIHVAANVPALPSRPIRLGSLSRFARSCPASSSVDMLFRARHGPVGLSCDASGGLTKLLLRSPGSLLECVGRGRDRSFAVCTQGLRHRKVTTCS